LVHKATSNTSGDDQLLADGWNLTPIYRDAMSLVARTIEGPGVPRASWTYQYANLGGKYNREVRQQGWPMVPVGQSEPKITIETQPDGVVKTYEFGKEVAYNDGLLLATSTSSGGAVVRTDRSVYYPDAELATAPFPRAAGRNLKYGATELGEHLNRPVQSTLTTQDGVQFNRLTNVRDGAGNTLIGLSYDVQGNLKLKNGLNHVFDYGNRLREVSGKESYRYDALGRRIFASAPGLGVVLSQYAQDGRLVFQSDGRKGLGREYVHLAGSLIARRDYAGVDAKITYLHTDSLGSPVASTDASGNVIERTHYEPYGAPIGKVVDGPGYTGHVMDGETGLVQMQQRYYDPQIGRFLSVDPVTAYSNPVGAFNRYWYANNNPYKFTDPDGRRACGKDTRCALEQGARGGVLMVNGGRSERSQQQAETVGKAATTAANNALSSIQEREFETPGSAARAWDDRVRRIADKFDAEIASRIFYSKDGVVLGSATSDGLRFSVNPDFSSGPTPCSITAGFVHTHPTMSLFSGNDLNYAIGQYRRANGWTRNGQFDQSAIVTLPGGRVVEWKVSSYMGSGGASYLNESYYNDH
jgi:RHS repeat-associated protein